jgi:high affinity sulfate transporter 1
LPLLQWDLLAGITLAMFVLPESMAYASLAGLPGEYGIYCCMAGGLVFALFTKGKQVAVGPTSAISLMVGTTIAGLSGGDPSRWIAIAQLTAFGVFIVCLIAYLLKLSTLVNFIGPNVLMGFKTGAALVIAATQLPKLFGVEGSSGNFFQRIYGLTQHMGETNSAVLIFGLVAFTLLLLGNHFLPGRPVSLLVVVGAILVVSFTSLGNMGLHLTGQIPSGLPHLSLPKITFKEVDGVLPLVLGIFLMGFIETSSVVRTFARKHKYPVDARQELLSLGVANLATGLASGFPVAGGLSQSTVNDKAGAKTPMAIIFCSAVLAIIMLFFTGLFKNLPEVILAVVVLDAVSGLLKIKELKRLYALNKVEFAVAMVAIAGVLTFGILKGVLIAALVSLVLLIKRVATPSVAILGQIPGTNRFSDITRHPENLEHWGFKILRIESSIFYFNEQHISQEIRAALVAAPKTHTLIIDLSSAPVVDVAGSDMLLDLCNDLKQQHIQVKMIDALSNVRDLLRQQGLEDYTGHLNRTDTISDLIAIDERK